MTPSCVNGVCVLVSPNGSRIVREVAHQRIDKLEADVESWSNTISMKEMVRVLEEKIDIDAKRLTLI